jgi:hypothetical protein
MEGEDGEGLIFFFRRKGMAMLLLLIGRGRRAGEMIIKHWHKKHS